MLPNSLVTPLNKGHEAMAYLTYLIDNYSSSLPSIVAFLHSHRSGFYQAWHVDNPLHDNVLAMRTLQLDFVVRNGYANLRCNWNAGCLKRHRSSKHITIGIWADVFNGTSTPHPDKAMDLLDSLSPSASRRELGRLLDTHIEIGAACCAQFVVSRDQILRRPLDDYVKLRQWLLKTQEDDYHSGRVFEYSWHVIFGKDPV